MNKGRQPRGIAESVGSKEGEKLAQYWTLLAVLNAVGSKICALRRIASQTTQYACASRGRQGRHIQIPKAMPFEEWQNAASRLSVTGTHPISSIIKIVVGDQDPIRTPDWLRKSSPR